MQNLYETYLQQKAKTQNIDETELAYSKKTNK